MRKVNKDFSDVPSFLKTEAVKDAFDKNIKEKKYIDKKSRYKDASYKTVRKKLNNIYNNKCIYCERSFDDIDTHIEHYRPKSIYYWLSYSWDNLFLACAECNRPKANKFELDGLKINYKNERFNDIHNLGDNYDIIEKPKTINPEKENIYQYLEFNNKGEVFSKNNRVNYSIKLCKLNRNELIKNRVKVWNDFLMFVKDYYNIFMRNKDINIFRPIINKIINYDEKTEYYSFRKYIIENIESLLENENKEIKFIIINLVNILKK